MTLDYINLDLALSTICKQRCGEHHTAYDCGSVCEIVEALNALPVEALRPVIRCRECKHYLPEYPDLECSVYQCCMGNGWPGPDGYCYRGERKDGAENATD